MAHPKHAHISDAVGGGCVGVVERIHADVLLQDGTVREDKLLLPPRVVYKIYEHVHLAVTKGLFHLRHVVIADHLGVKAGIHADGL